MIVGKITAKSQTTVPRAVRLALGLAPGDELAWEIRDDQVFVRRVASLSGHESDGSGFGDFSTFTEWASEADCKAYDNL